jgi:hypothetical protein
LYGIDHSQVLTVKIFLKIKYNPIEEKLRIPLCHDIMPHQVNCLTILVDLVFEWMKEGY